MVVTANEDNFLAPELPQLLKPIRFPHFVGENTQALTFFAATGGVAEQVPYTEFFRDLANGSFGGLAYYPKCIFRELFSKDSGPEHGDVLTQTTLKQTDSGLLLLVHPAVMLDVVIYANQIHHANFGPPST